MAGSSWWISTLAIFVISAAYFPCISAITFNAPENGNASATVAEGVLGDVYTLNATADMGTLAYNITSQTPADAFTILDNAAGVISVLTMPGGASSLDYETNMQHVLTVDATNGSLTATASLTIVLTDVNDNAPVFTEQSCLFTIPDGSTSGTSVGIASATDADGVAPNNVIFFNITGGSGNETFEIDSASGAITVASGVTVNYEMKSYTLALQATDAVGTASNNDASVTCLIGVCKAQSGADSAIYSIIQLALACACAMLSSCRLG